MATKGRRAFVTPEMFLEMRRLRAKGLESSQIGQRVGVSSATVGTYAPKHDVDLPLEVAVANLTRRLRDESKLKARSKGLPDPRPENGSWAARDDALDSVMRAVSGVAQSTSLGPNHLALGRPSTSNPGGAAILATAVLQPCWPELDRIRMEAAKADRYVKAAELLDGYEDQIVSALLEVAAQNDRLTPAEREYLRFAEQMEGRA